MSSENKEQNKEDKEKDKDKEKEKQEQPPKTEYFADPVPIGRIYQAIHIEEREKAAAWRARSTPAEIEKWGRFAYG